MNETRRSSIRRARRRDLPEIIDLARALARHVEDKPPAWSRAELQSLAFGPRRWCDLLVAVDAGLVVGVAVLARVLQLHEGKRKLNLADLIVAADLRGGGVGEALMVAVARHALRLGCETVFWDVWVENAVAYRFYDRIGASRDDAVVTSMSLDKVNLKRLVAQERLGRL